MRAIMECDTCEFWARDGNMDEPHHPACPNHPGPFEVRIGPTSAVRFATPAAMSRCVEHLAVGPCGARRVTVRRIDEDETAPLAVGDKVVRVRNGSEVEGEVRAAFTNKAGHGRFVFEFDNPPGLLFICSREDLRKI